MINLCADIGFNSLNKYKEELCGDQIEMIEGIDGSTTLVLADGLGSGVKANILSTLTAKIISTMMAEGLSITDCVETIAETLPVCATRGIAYSTFTILRILSGNREAEIIQYDNPKVILLRNGENFEIPYNEMIIGGKNVLISKIDLQEDDLFIIMSDGCIHAGVGSTLNFGWDRKEIIEYISPLTDVGFTAKTLNTILLDECYSLYGAMPGDDTTSCMVRIRKRQPMNLIIGPPSNENDTDKMMSLFFSKEGKHIVCGGTTSSLAARYLGKEVVPSLDFFDSDVPPTAHIEGVDLVTEGIITINKVLSYAKDYLDDNKLYSSWSNNKDGASTISRLLFEQATDINFYVGKAVNPAHQNPNLPINFNIKMQLIEELSHCLKKIGKKIKVSYF